MMSHISSMPAASARPSRLLLDAPLFHSSSQDPCVLFRSDACAPHPWVF
jgi:hypothetical protein